MNPDLYRSVCRFVIILITPGLFLSFSAFAEINGYTEQSAYSTTQASESYSDDEKNNALQAPESHYHTDKNKTLQEPESHSHAENNNTLQVSEFNPQTDKNKTLQEPESHSHAENNNTLQVSEFHPQTDKNKTLQAPESHYHTDKNKTLQEPESHSHAENNNTLQVSESHYHAEKNNTLQVSGSFLQSEKNIPLQEEVSSRQSENKIVANPVAEKIVILHTNDHHFTANNLAALKDTIVHIRQKYETVFLVSAGDIFVRHPARWIVNGKLMISRNWFGDRALFMINNMNDLGYDLMTLGNHEFDYREPYTFAALDAANFPLLAANIEITTDAIPPLDAYAILNTTAGSSIAFLGLTIASGGKEGVRALDAFETAAGYISLRDSADIFVALTHIGLRRDYQLAEIFPDFDVIVGGHSHDLLEEAELVNGVLIAQAGGNPHIVMDTHPVYLGKIILTLENGEIVGKKGRIIHVGTKPLEIEEATEKEAEVEVEVETEKEAEIEVEVETEY